MKKISANHLKVFEYLKGAGNRWLSVNQIVHHTGMENSVVNKTLRLWHKEGLLHRSAIFQAYLYHLREGYEENPLWEKLTTALSMFQSYCMTFDDLENQR